MNRDNRAIKGSLVLALGAFVSKILGAIYRIPLLNIITSEGIGIYQMIFPLYCILLDFAGASAPSAISKIIAQNDKIVAQRYLKNSIFLLVLLGLFFSLFMLFISYPISILQGNKNAFLGYVMLSPAIFFVGIISCFRGYYQGLMNMTPTAISQIIEQAVKLLFGLLLTKLFMPNIPLAVGGATLAVSISELFALLYLIFRFKIKDKKETLLITKNEKKSDIKEIISFTIPFTLVGIALPFSNLFDSFYIINILKKYIVNATSIYGLYSGAAITIISLPVSLCYGFSVTAIPYISGNIEKKTKANKIMFFTFIVSFLMAIATYFFAGIITNFLFNKLSSEEKELTISLIKLMSINVVLLSVLQTQNSILISLNKRYFPLISMGIAIVIKTILSIILLNNERINIYGCGIGLIACYFFAVLINFIILKRKKNDSKEHNRRRMQNKE